MHPSADGSELIYSLWGFKRVHFNGLPCYKMILISFNHYNDMKPCRWGKPSLFLTYTTIPSKVTARHVSMHK